MGLITVLMKFLTGSPLQTFVHSLFLEARVAVQVGRATKSQDNFLIRPAHFGIFNFTGKAGDLL